MPEQQLNVQATYPFFAINLTRITAPVVSVNSKSPSFTTTAFGAIRRKPGMETLSSGFSTISFYFHSFCLNPVLNYIDQDQFHCNYAVGRQFPALFLLWKHLSSIIMPPPPSPTTSAAQQITHAHTVRPASNWRMRSYKSPVPVPAAVARVSQSSQPSSTHLLKFPFLRFATLSFAIPPPISASVRSRQAGTETEREASAMEALGPGEESRRNANGSGASEPCVGRASLGAAALGEALTR